MNIEYFISHIDSIARIGNSAKKSPRMRFWDELTKLKNGCWKRNSGSGYIRIGEKRITQRMFSFILHNERMPNGILYSLCNNEKCVNPDHILEGTLENRFWNCIEKGVNKNDCWKWNGAHTGAGYGAIRKDKDQEFVLVHRLSWEYHNGKIPLNMIVCHHCDNPECTNPKHLFLGTHKDNAQDKIKKKRCNFPKGIQHHNSKLTDKQVREIRNMYSTQNISYQKIANLYNMSCSSIRRIIIGKGWRHVK